MKKIIVIATLLALPGLSFAKNPINHQEAKSGMLAYHGSKRGEKVNLREAISANPADFNKDR